MFQVFHEIMIETFVEIYIMLHNAIRPNKPLAHWQETVLKALALFVSFAMLVMFSSGIAFMCVDDGLLWIGLGLLIGSILIFNVNMIMFLYTKARMKKNATTETPEKDLKNTQEAVWNDDDILEK